MQEVLPRAMYWVRLDDGRRVRVGLSTSARRSVVRLIAGDRVEVRLSAYDPTRGQIVRKR